MHHCTNRYQNFSSFTKVSLIWQHSQMALSVIYTKPHIQEGHNGIKVSLEFIMQSIFQNLVVYQTQKNESCLMKS